MQNIDFYSGKMSRDVPTQLNSEDPEYFARLANVHTKEEEKSMKRATRMLFLIVALCIISFTIGLVIGIKFVNGSKTEIVDERTKRAVDNIGKKVANIIKDSTVTDLNAAPVNKNLFSKTQFPYAVKIPGEYSKTKSQEIAGLLSNNGQTVIISKNYGKYRIFLGPFRQKGEAAQAIKNLKNTSNSKYISDAAIIKR